MKHSSQEFTEGKSWKLYSKQPVVGLDLGSRAAKSALIHQEQRPLMASLKS